MKKLLALLVLPLALLLTASAAPVSPDRARAIALASMRSAAARSASGTAAQQTELTLVKTATPRAKSGGKAQGALYYVFDKGEDGGIIIVAGDDRMRPVLGYTDRGSFAGADDNPGMRWWLEAVGRAAEAIASGEAPAEAVSGLKAAQEAAAASSMGGVEPLVKTQWGQNEPFNLLCPYDYEHDGQSVTGCVATAMAQLFYYWRYPEKGTGTAAYRTGKHGITVSANLADHPFDYDKMLTYYTGYDSDEANQAVAQLMYACAVSHEMDFCAYASSASISLEKLVNMFGFDPSCASGQREHFTPAEWESLIRHEIDQQRPVLYRGENASGGHIFICDGYDEAGLFHINWGWYGSYDGYFDLASLNSDNIPADGYTINQQVYYGLKPAGAQGGTAYDCSLYYESLSLGTTTTCNAGDIIRYNITHLECQGLDYDGYIGTAIYDAGGNLVDADCSSRFSLQNNYYYGSYDMIYTTPASLPDGTYTLRPVCGPSPDNIQPLKGAEGNGLPTTVKLTAVRGTITLELPTGLPLSLSVGGKPEAEGGSVYAGVTANVNIPITNTGAYYNGMVTVTRADDGRQVFADNFIIDEGETRPLLTALTVDEGDTEAEFIVSYETPDNPAAEAGRFTLQAQQRAEGAPAVSVESVTIADNSLTYGERMSLTATYTNQGGFYNGYAFVRIDIGGRYYYCPVEDMMINKGERKDVVFDIDLKEVLDILGPREGTGTATPGHVDMEEMMYILSEAKATFTVTDDGSAPAPAISIVGEPQVMGGSAYAGRPATIILNVRNDGADYLGTLMIFDNASGEHLSSGTLEIAANSEGTFKTTIQLPAAAGERTFNVYRTTPVNVNEYIGSFSLNVLQPTAGAPALTAEGLSVATPTVGADGELRFTAAISNLGGFYEGEIVFNLLLTGAGGGPTGGNMLRQAVEINGGETKTLNVVSDLRPTLANLGVNAAEGTISVMYYDAATDSYVTLDATGAFTVNLTTGVSQVEAEREAAPVYSISGLRVGTTADIDRLPAGIYISRGKKFIVK